MKALHQIMSLVFSSYILITPSHLMLRYRRFGLVRETVEIRILSKLFRTT